MQPSTRRLYEAITTAIGTFRKPTPDEERLLRLARQDYYHDFMSPSAMPATELVSHLRLAGLNELAERAMGGEFDATKEEADAWAATDEGRATFQELMGRD